MFARVFSVFLISVVVLKSSSPSSVPSKEPRVLNNDYPIVDKTVKILTGYDKPSPIMSPPMQTNHNNYYQNSNQYPPQFPYNPDLSGQGSGPQPSYENPPPPQNQNGNNGVAEIYVQIIGAMEKLVGRMDKLESRMGTMENIIYHTTKKEKEPPKGNCPESFVKVEGIRNKCFHFSSLSPKGGSLYDWKSAHTQCNKLGGRLTELVNYDDFLRMSQFLGKYAKSKDTSGSTDFWIGGINPGLIWIWSESGQKVGLDRQLWNDNDNSSNAPGCLKLSYSRRLDSFFFKGAPCSHSQNIVCEILDNSVARSLALFEQELLSNTTTTT